VSIIEATCGRWARSRPAIECAYSGGAGDRPRTGDAAQQDVQELRPALRLASSSAVRSGITHSGWVSARGHRGWWARPCAGDTHLLLEIGQPELNLVLRFRAMRAGVPVAWSHAVARREVSDPRHSLACRCIPARNNAVRPACWRIVEDAWEAVVPARDLKVPSRIVHLPRPWGRIRLPNWSIEQIMNHGPEGRALGARSNLELSVAMSMQPAQSGKQQKEKMRVYRHGVSTPVSVMGWATCIWRAVATPLDPRHRLVPHQIQSGRPWTAGEYGGHRWRLLCASYGLEGPGG